MSFEAPGAHANPHPDPGARNTLPLQQFPVRQGPSQAERAGGAPAGHAIDGVPDGVHPGPVARMDLGEDPGSGSRPGDVAKERALGLAPDTALGPKEGHLGAKEK